MKKFILIFLLFCTTAVFAEDKYEGFWLGAKKEVIYEIKKEANGTYSATIVWIKEPVYPEGHQFAGEPKYDLKNKNHSLQKRQLLGLKIAGALEDIKGHLQHGWYYKFRTGRKYYASARVKNNKLKLKGTVDKRGILGIATGAKRIDPADYDLE